MNDERDAVNERVAELLLAEFETAVHREEFGVVAQDVAMFDKQHFLAMLPDQQSMTLFPSSEER